jgi:hypothetical protein
MKNPKVTIVMIQRRQEDGTHCYVVEDVTNTTEYPIGTSWSKREVDDMIEGGITIKIKTR